MHEEPWQTAFETCIAPEAPDFTPIDDEVTEQSFAKALAYV